MVQVECLVCGETLRMPQYIDPDNYDGQVVCQQCRALLHIKLAQSKVRKYRVVNTNMVVPEIKVITAIPKRDYSKKAQGDVKES